ncbi:MAG: DNA repair protein RecN [Candidatus Cloacimonetes bacterium HGW-Cloacimonetes-3]|jgi:DNA repair protein RecN (Recombination protein N)|nr:MAG: DNA repair protein RecN [Candidatus Cloacimonetes bacterium HGW-Cloacimonetes-3]
MLTEIYIKNYLMLPEIRLSFEAGLTVLSGETGAGKSILVGSISLIFGDSQPGLEAYDKSQPIYLEASFRQNGDPMLQSLLSASGVQPDEEVILAREISPAGKSTYYLGGRKVSSGVLKELKPFMIDFHHQRDQQRLLSQSYQLELLDAFAEADALREEFSILYHRTKENMKSLQGMKAEAEKQKQLQELYQFQFEELEAAKLSSGEDTALMQEYDLLSHVQEINEISQSINISLFEQENSVYDQVNSSLSQISRFENLNPHLQEASKSLTQSLEAMQEAAAHLSSMSETLSTDPDRMEAIQTRLDTINTLLYKHKVRSIEELLELFTQRSIQLSSLNSRQDAISGLEKQLQEDFLLLQEKADELSDKRHSAAVLLKVELENGIRDLSIPNGRFEIRIDKKSKAEKILSEFISAVSETGQDTLQFMFSANPGFDLKPLAAVVSGGELSRILLAIKKVLASRIPEKLIILDEIDSGIGGKTAGNVAEFIASLSKRQQILCITHLAQIAAVADCHIAITKDKVDARSRISMQILDSDKRLQEIARMLSGSLSSTAVEHARELLSEIKQRG